MTEREVRQTVIGDRNIVTGTGDVNIVYTLPPTEAEERRSLLVLLERVRQFWIAGVLDGSVHGAALLELGTARMSEAVEHPWERILELPGEEARAVPVVLSALEGQEHVEVVSVTVSRPSLDDVYLRHTGRAFATADEEGAKQ